VAHEISVASVNQDTHVDIQQEGCVLLVALHDICGKVAVDLVAARPSADVAHTERDADVGLVDKVGDAGKVVAKARDLELSVHVVLAPVTAS